LHQAVVLIQLLSDVADAIPCDATCILWVASMNNLKHYGGSEAVLAHIKRQGSGLLFHPCRFMHTRLLHALMG
jgi:hypothetical protein